MIASRIRRLVISDHLSKTQNFSSEITTVGTSRKRAPHESDRDYSFGRWLENHPLFLSFCSQPLNATLDLYVRRTVCTRQVRKCDVLSVLT